MKRKTISILLLISCVCLVLVAAFLLCLSMEQAGLLPENIPFLQWAAKINASREDSQSQIPLEEAEYPGIVSVSEANPYELYYLYDFLYIGDSFIQRLADSGILHESCTVLAKSGTSAKDWYVKENNERYVDYLEELKSLEDTPYRGIILYYGINYIRSAKNITYMERLMDDIQETFPDVPLFVLKIMPVAEQFVLLRSDGSVRYRSEEINRDETCSVAAYNKDLEKLCRKKGAIFIDTTDGFLDEKGNLAQNLADKRGLHIAEDYIIDWCQNIFEAVTSK